MGSDDEDRDSVHYVRDKIKQIFETAREQFKHQTLLEKCKKLHKKCSDEKLFLQEFIHALRYALVFPNKLAVDNILQFVAKFIIFLYSIESNQNNLDLSDTISEVYIFPSGILQFIFQCHGASLLEVRLRCLQLLNNILSGMPENSTISDKMWYKLKETVLRRIQDKSPAVRAQAVLTGRKLQDPKNSDCEIIKAFLFHLNDPSSAVRRTVVSSIAFNKLTIGHVLARTRDVNDNVRRNTYIIFSKVRMLNLTIKYRLIILERGLQDRSAMVRNCVQSILLVNWFDSFDNDVVKFLEALDVINCPDVSLKVAESILKILPISEIISQLHLDKETRIIPQDKLTPEAALLWKAVTGYLKTEEIEEKLDDVLPNITTYCDFIRNFYPLETNKNPNLSKDEKWTEIKKNEILKHLLDLIKYFDFQDEMGRTNLKKLISDMLISQRIDNNIAERLIELLAPVVPSTEIFLHEVTEIISEIREPLTVEFVRPNLEEKQKMEIELNISNLKLALNELREREYNAVISKEYNEAQTIKDEIEKIEATIKTLNQQEFISQEIREEKNDPETICKCLTILVHMIKFSDVKTLTPTLQNIKENFLNQCLTSQDLLTQGLAIQALGQFCALDVEIAKENLYRFILMLSEKGDDEINGPALKSIFDILLVHGIKPFEKLHNCESEEEVIVIQEEKKKKDDDDDDHDDDDDDEDDDDDDEDEDDEDEDDEDEDDEDEDVEDDYSKAKKRSLSDDGDFLYGDQKYKEAPFLNEAKFIRILMELLNCKSNDVLKSIAFEGFCKLLLSGVIYSTSLLEKIIIKGFSPIIENEHEDYIRQVFMVFFPIFASSTPRSQEMIEAAFIPTVKSIILAALGTPEADINPKDVALFLIDHTRSNINKESCRTLHVHNNLAMSLCHEILNEYDQCTELGILQFYVKLLTQLEISLDCDSFINQIQVLIRKIKKVLGDRTLLKSLSEFERKVQNGVQSKLPSTESTSISAKLDSRKSKELLDVDDPDSMDSVSKRDEVYSNRNQLEKCDMERNLRESESADESQESDESVQILDFQPRIKKQENNFIPESPDISE